MQGVPAATLPGEQGSAVKLLTVAFSGETVTAFLQIIKTVPQSRGPAFELTLRRGKDRLEITADSIEEAMPLIKELIDGS